MAKKILVIEDQEAMLKMLGARLKANGYQVVLVADGLDGIEKANKELPDLVITDLALPRMNGNVIVRILKQSEKHKSIPIIVLSAFVHAGMGAGVEVPADAYMAKPFEADQLIAKVRELLKESPK